MLTSVNGSEFDGVEGYFPVGPGSVTSPPPSALSGVLERAYAGASAGRSGLSSASTPVAVVGRPPSPFEREEVIQTPMSGARGAGGGGSNPSSSLPRSSGIHQRVQELGGGATPSHSSSAGPARKVPLPASSVGSGAKSGYGSEATVTPRQVSGRQIPPSQPSSEHVPPQPLEDFEVQSAAFGAAGARGGPVGSGYVASSNSVDWGKATPGPTTDRNPSNPVTNMTSPNPSTTTARPIANITHDNPNANLSGIGLGLGTGLGWGSGIVADVMEESLSTVLREREREAQLQNQVVSPGTRTVSGSAKSNARSKGSAEAKGKEKEKIPSPSSTDQEQSVNYDDEVVEDELLEGRSSQNRRSISDAIPAPTQDQMEEMQKPPSQSFNSVAGTPAPASAKTPKTPKTPKSKTKSASGSGSVKGPSHHSSNSYANLASAKPSARSGEGNVGAAGGDFGYVDESAKKVESPMRASEDGGSRVPVSCLRSIPQVDTSRLISFIVSSPTHRRAHPRLSKSSPTAHSPRAPLLRDRVSPSQLAQGQRRRSQRYAMR